MCLAILPSHRCVRMGRGQAKRSLSPDGPWKGAWSGKHGEWEVERGPWTPKIFWICAVPQGKFRAISSFPLPPSSLRLQTSHLPPSLLPSTDLELQVA